MKRKTRASGLEAESTIDKVRRIVDQHQAEKIDGMLVDGTTAQIVIAIYDNLNEQNKARLAAMPIGLMCAFSLKLYGKVRRG